MNEEIEELKDEIIFRKKIEAELRTRIMLFEAAYENFKNALEINDKNT